MNCNNSKYDVMRNNLEIKKTLVAKGIQQAWYRHCLSSRNIHSGVRVKIHRKASFQLLQLKTINQNDNMQPERLNDPSQKELFNHRQMKLISNVDPKNKNRNNVGVQTVTMIKVDQKTSCNIITSKENSGTQFSTSISQTSMTDETSTYADNSSTEISIMTNSKDDHEWYQRNNNAIHSDVDHKPGHMNAKIKQPIKNVSVIMNHDKNTNFCKK